MGDFRFTLKAKFSMGDVEEEKEFNLNYSPHDTILDHRIEEWLSGGFERGASGIRQRMHEADTEARRREKLAEEDAIIKRAEEIQKQRMHGK